MDTAKQMEILLVQFEQIILFIPSKWPLNFRNTLFYMIYLLHLRMQQLVTCKPVSKTTYPV